MAQQMQIEGFTRTGFRVVVSDTVKDTDAGKKLIESVGFLGLLPAPLEKSDEHQHAYISHVALTTTDDGTPHVAFYHANEKMEMRFTHKYLNSQAERAEFEAWSGLKLADMQAQDGNVHPQRGKATFAKYAVALPKGRALIRVTRYTKEVENGQDIWKPENDVESYIMPKAEEKKAEAKGDWWDTKELDRVQLWINQASIAKPELIEKACKAVTMHEYKTPEDYITALKQAVFSEEKKASGEDIPFSQ